MRKLKKEIKEMEVITTEDILCNKCGNTCYSDCNYEGIIEYNMCGGYGSKLGDMTRFLFSICEDCMFEIMKTFKLNPLQSVDYDCDEIDLEDIWNNFKKGSD